MRGIAKWTWATGLGAAVRVALAAVLMLGSLATIAAPALAQDEDAQIGFATATLAPESSLAYLAINLDLESDQWQATQELLGRIGFPNAIDDLKAQMVADMEDVDDPEAATEAILGGEVGVVITEQLITFAMKQAEAEGTDLPFEAPATDTGGIGVAVIVLPGDPDAAWELLEAELERTATTDGVTVEETDYNGTTIFSTPAEEDAEGGMAVARQDDYILAAGFPQDLEPIIDTANGDTPALSDFGPLNDISGALSPEALFFGFLNGAALFDTLGPEFAQAIEQFAPQMGGAGAWQGYFGTVLWADQPGFRMDTVAMMAEGGSFADLVPANADVTMDERVPGESLFFVGGHTTPGMWSGAALSVAQAINGAMGTTEEPPEVTDMFSEEYIEEQFAAAEQVLGFDLRADFFDLLGGEYGLAFNFPNMMSGGFDVDAVFVTGVDDAGTISESLAKIVNLIKSMGDAVDVSTRQVEGSPVYVIQDPNSTETPSFEFGVVGEELIMGVGSGLDDAVNGPATSLADNEQYQEVLGTLPDEYSQVVYFDISQIVPFFMMMSGSGGADIVDADPACADYETQEAAQEAYDDDPFENSALDQDFDGEACEDFFAPATPEAETAPTGSLEALKAFAAVSYLDGDIYGQSAILFIAEE
jgi:hypothetical protein